MRIARIATMCFFVSFHASAATQHGHPRFTQEPAKWLAKNVQKIQERLERKIARKHTGGPTGPVQDRPAGREIQQGQAYDMGRRALELTNEFRARHGLPALSWHQDLANIGAEHSQNMARNRVGFGHDGFDTRVDHFPMTIRSAAENVAYNKGFSDPVKMAIKGWIESDGHRKNLLSHHKWCGIGVGFSASGKVYFTQLFAL